MKTSTTFSERHFLRDTILTHFLTANKMASITNHPDLKGHYDIRHIQKVVYALANSGLLFESGRTNARLYMTTSVGKKVIDG